MTVLGLERLGGNWGIILLEGIAVFILGVLLVASPGATLVVLMTLIGAYLLANGLVSLVRVFRPARGAHWGWSLVIAIVSILAGAYLLGISLYGAVNVTTTLVLILGIVTVVMGVVIIVRGFRGEGCGSIVLGALWILIGLLLINNREVSSVVLIYTLGILGILGGLVLAVVAIAVRQQNQAAAEAAE